MMLRLHSSPETSAVQYCIMILLRRLILLSACLSVSLSALKVRFNNVNENLVSTVAVDNRCS